MFYCLEYCIPRHGLTYVILFSAHFLSCANNIWNVIVTLLFHGSIEKKNLFKFQVISINLFWICIVVFLIKVTYKGLYSLDVDRWQVLYYGGELTQARWSKAEMKCTPWPGQEGQFHINMSKLINTSNLFGTDEIEMAT